MKPPAKRTEKKPPRKFAPLANPKMRAALYYARKRRLARVAAQQGS